MKHDTDTAPMGRNDDGVSLTKVTIDELTRFERREVIPECDFVIVGYDSSYSDEAESTKRLVDPANTKVDFNPHDRVSGEIVGKDADDPDRTIGVSFGKRSGGKVHTSKASGRIGVPLWVKYPADEPPKTTYDVTFRALAGNWSTRTPIEDVDVDSMTEQTVDKFSYDGLATPPEGERRVEDVQVDDGSTMGTDVRRKVAVDIPVRITVVDDVDRDDMVERARNRIGITRLSSYEPDKAEWVDDIAPIGEHVFEREGFGMNDRNLRDAVWYWIEDVDVEAVDE